jgi:hypothetical protein
MDPHSFGQAVKEKLPSLYRRLPQAAFGTLPMVAAVHLLRANQVPSTGAALSLAVFSGPAVKASPAAWPAPS